MKAAKHPAQSQPAHRLRRLVLALLFTALAGACAAGLVVVDRNTRRTGLSNAPALVDLSQTAPRQYRLELLGGRWVVTFRLPWDA